MDAALIIRDYLVYVPQHDATPQRMRLRVKRGQDVQDILYQIERQLEGDAVPSLSDPQSCSRYSIFALDDCKTALIPLADAPLEMLQVSSALYVLADTTPHSHLQLTQREAGDVGEWEVTDSVDVAENDGRPVSGVMDEEAQAALPQERATSQSALPDKEMDASQGGVAQANEGQGAVRCSNCCDAERQLGTMRAMLRIVDRVCADLALHTIPGHRPMDEQEWQTLLAYALERQKMTESQLDESTVRAFRRAIVDPISRVQHLRDKPQAASLRSTSPHLASSDSPAA